MSGELTRFEHNGGLVRDARRAGRSVSKYQAGGLVRTTTVDVDTDVALAKVDALTAATGQAMGAVVRIAQAQKHLELLAPEAFGRSAFLADDHLLAISGTLTDLRRSLRGK